MKNKKAVFIVLGLIVLVVIVGVIIAAIKNKKEKDNTPKVPTTFTVTYSYGGGFGLVYDMWTREIKVDQDGNVTISLKDGDIDIEPVTYNVGKDKAKELMDVIFENKFYNLDKDLSNKDVVDAGSSYIEVKSNTFNHKAGGYAVDRKRFMDIRKKIWDLVDLDKLNKFDNDIKEAYEKERSND